MEPSYYAPNNLIERIFELPTELKRLVLYHIWPTTLRLHYYEPNRYCDPWSERPVRLTSPVASSAMSQESVFRLSDHMINRGWYKAATEHLNTTTIWNLGDVEQLVTYLRRRFDQEYRPVLHEAFLRRLRSVQHTSVSVRPRSVTYGTLNWRTVRLLLRFPEFVDGHLPLSTVRFHLDDLFALPSDQQDVWAITITKFARLVFDNNRAVRRSLQVKVACSQKEISSRRGQGFMDMIRQHCGPDTVQWNPTGDCRYQGRLGDLIVMWKGGGSAFRIQDVRLLLISNRSQPHMDILEGELDTPSPDMSPL